MADNIMFKIDDTDYSTHVVAENYAVRNIPQYKSWIDANGNEHRSVYRKQISGSFNMYFATIEEFDIFCALLDSVQKNDTSYPCTVWINNENTAITADYFIDFDATRYRNVRWADQIEMLKISIKER